LIQKIVHGKNYLKTKLKLMMVCKSFADPWEKLFKKVEIDDDI
jgi:hypothetical protein